MQTSSLFVRQVGLDRGTLFSMYEVRDARDQNHVIAMVSGPGDDGKYGEILAGTSYRKLTPEELERVNALIKLGDEADTDRDGD